MAAECWPAPVPEVADAPLLHFSALGRSKFSNFSCALAKNRTTTEKFTKKGEEEKRGGEKYFLVFNFPMKTRFSVYGSRYSTSTQQRNCTKKITRSRVKSAGPGWRLAGAREDRGSSIPFSATKLLKLWKI